jgi:prepilin-type N-terminal cleavage/methylation domain-containing protein
LHGGWRSDAGFSLAEMTVSMAVLLIVSNVVFTGIARLSDVNASVHNRSEMHSGVRNATELLQQEVGQAGRITLPAPVTLTAGAAAGTNTVGVSSAAGMFVGERLVIGTGANEETVTLTGVNPDADTITATFVGTHPAGTPILVHGGFASGVVPTSTPNGSSGTVLKIFGDVDGDGNMRYVEYTCDTAAGNLYRNTMPFDAEEKPVVTVAEVLLNNLLPNPDGTPCFTYQEKSVSGTDFVVQVAITLTVQTGDPDPITGLFQTETKALLNVSPRNVFHVWQLASLGITNRVQPMPASVADLLAD